VASYAYYFAYSPDEGGNVSSSVGGGGIISFSGRGIS
jgi:hypothetical protein